MEPFCSPKAVGLASRPVVHLAGKLVHFHGFLCMLDYYFGVHYACDDYGRVARPLGNAVTDPRGRLSRTRFLSEVRRITHEAASMDA